MRNMDNLQRWRNECPIIYFLRKILRVVFWTSKIFYLHLSSKLSRRLRVELWHPVLNRNSAWRTCGDVGMCHFINSKRRTSVPKFEKICYTQVPISNNTGWIVAIQFSFKGLSYSEAVCKLHVTFFTLHMNFQARSMGSRRETGILLSARKVLIMEKVFRLFSKSFSGGLLVRLWPRGAPIWKIRGKLRMVWLVNLYLLACIYSSLGKHKRIESSAIFLLGWSLGGLE